jgi:hypothetical protein
MAACAYFQTKGHQHMLRQAGAICYSYLWTTVLPPFADLLCLAFVLQGTFDASEEVAAVAAQQMGDQI